MKIRTELTVEQKKRIAAEQELALKGPELKACQKALAAARTEKEWEDLWSERRPDKHFQLQDALSKSSSSSSEKKYSSEDENNLAAAFLKGLKKGQSQPAKGEEHEKKEKTRKTSRKQRQMENLQRLARKPKQKKIN